MNKHLKTLESILNYLHKNKNNYIANIENNNNNDFNIREYSSDNIYYAFELGKRIGKSQNIEKILELSKTIENEKHKNTN